MMVQALDPNLKTEYHEGDAVEFVISAERADGSLPIRTGKIRGISVRDIIDWWIVEIDEPIPGWEFSCVTVQHTHLRRAASNFPFLCQTEELRARLAE